MKHHLLFLSSIAICLFQNLQCMELTALAKIDKRLMKQAKDSNIEQSVAFFKDCSAPDAQDANKRTRLHFAASLYDTESITELLDIAPTLVMQTNVLQETPLHCALTEHARYADEAQKQLATCRLLLSRGAAPKAQTITGHSCIDYAHMFLSHPATIIELLIKGTALFDIDSNLRLCAKHTIYEGSVIELTQSCTATVQDRTGRNRLHYALDLNALHEVHALLALPNVSSFINTPDNNDTTPLFILFSCTIESSELSTAKIPELCAALLRNGADPYKGPQGVTLLEYIFTKIFYEKASIIMLPELIKLIAPNHALINMPNTFGETPLHILLNNHTLDPKTLLPLLKHADPNSCNALGQSPLHYLAIVPHYEEETLQQLLNLGAQIDIQTTTGETPLHHIVQRHKRNDNFDQRLDRVRHFVKRGANPNIQNGLGMTPLHLLVATPCTDARHALAVYLLLHKADPNKTSKEGFAPLHTAVLTLQPRWVELLLHGSAAIPTIIPTDITLTTQPAYKNASKEKGKTALALARELLEKYVVHKNESSETTDYEKVAAAQRIVALLEAAQQDVEKVSSSSTLDAALDN